MMDVKQYLPEILAGSLSLLGVAYLITEETTTKTLPSEFDHYKYYKGIVYLLFAYLIYSAWSHSRSKQEIDHNTGSGLFIGLFIIIILAFIYTFFFKK